MQNIQRFKVRKRKCQSCPFREGGSMTIRCAVMARLLTASQTCHSSRPNLRGKDTMLCRGARDEQLTMMYRLGVIAEPTDAAWDAQRARQGV